MLRQKQGVRLDLDIRMRPALLAVGRVWTTLPVEPTVTAGRDGEHSAGSLHYYGLAFDLRTRDIAARERERVWSDLKGQLRPQGFDVVLHSTHIHIEYDPKESDG